ESLGPAEQKEAAVVEGEVQPGQYPSLGLGIQVHQGIPAGEQIDSGYRCVVDQVVAPEDDLPAEILAEEVETVQVLEVPGEELGGNSLDLPVLVGGVTGSVERVVVDIGGVDLDPLAELVQAQLLGQDHRNGVCLLA